LGQSVSDLKPETYFHYVLGETRPARQCRRLPVLSGHPSSGACRHGGPRSPVPARWPATASGSRQPGCALPLPAGRVLPLIARYSDGEVTGR